MSKKQQRKSKANPKKKKIIGIVNYPVGKGVAFAPLNKGKGILD